MQTLAVLNTLARHDVVSIALAADEAPGEAQDMDISPETEWHFTVELMRQWVRQRDIKK